MGARRPANKLLLKVTVAWTRVVTVDMLSLVRFWIDFEGTVITIIDITSFIIGNAMVIIRVTVFDLLL